MRKKSKSAAILAVVMAMTLAGSSAVYAEENSSAIIQANITKEQISPKTSSFRGFLYIPINLSDTTKTHEISTVTNK